MIRTIDQLILGSNPLFGADHVSSERARMRRSEMTSRRIVEIMRESAKAGATGFTFTNEPSILDIFRLLRNEPDLPNMRLYPLVPDSSLIPSLLSKGAVRTASEVIQSLSWSRRASALARGGWSYLTGNPSKAAMIFLEAEIERLGKAAPTAFDTETILLQEHFADLALGLELDEILVEYLNHVRDHLRLTPGIETRNLVRLVEFLERSSLTKESIVIMTPINPLGFQMSPNREEVEAALGALKAQKVIGISILAGGVLRLSDSINYLKTIAKLDSVAVGVSSASQARETFPLLRHSLFGGQ